MTTKTRTVNFSIDGAGFTAIVRDLMRSDKPAKAWKLIVDGLIGSGNTERMACQLLDGKLKLVGSSDKEGLSFVKDEDPATAKYLDDVKFIFAGRVRVNGSWWRPKAAVTDLGPADLEQSFAANRSQLDTAATLAENNAALREVYRGRVAYYAREGEKVLEVRRKKGDKTSREFIIFEPVSEPPFWWREMTDVDKAFQEYVDAGRRVYQESWSATIQEELETLKATQRGTVHEMTTEVFSTREVLEDAQYAMREKSHRDFIEELRVKIRAAAGDNTFDLVVEGRGTFKVPTAPFMCWALGRTSLKHLAPPWTPISPPGMKLPMDDECHTDWMLGAGFNLREDYKTGSSVQMAAHTRQFEMQEEQGNFECGVIVGGQGGTVEGRVGGEIVVLPNLSPAHLDKLKYARAIITEKGGALAHLAQVALERLIPIVSVKDAVKRYPTGAKVLINLDKGTVTHEYDRV